MKPIMLIPMGSYATNDDGDTVVMMMMVYDDGGVGGGESRVRKSEGGDRIDRRMGSLFGLRRKYFPAMVGGWSPQSEGAEK
ncbi:hypothetical protein Tco_0065402 [Tanacetum coccineum]